MDALNAPSPLAPANDTTRPLDRRSSDSLRQADLRPPFLEVIAKRFPAMMQPPVELTPEERAAAEAKAERLRLAEEDRQRQGCRDAFLAQVGRRHCTCRFDNFETPTDAHRTALESIRRFAEDAFMHFAQGDGIVIFGPPGSGKDHLLIAAGAHVAYQERLRVKLVNGQALFAEMRDRIGKDEPEADFVRGFTRPDVLILSDPVPPSGALSDFQAGVLYRIVEARYSDCKPTWASLNVKDGQEAEARLGAAVVDRLRDGALVIHANWPSYRRAIS